MLFNGREYTLLSDAPPPGCKIGDKFILLDNRDIDAEVGTIMTIFHFARGSNNGCFRQDDGREFFLFWRRFAVYRSNKDREAPVYGEKLRLIDDMYTDNATKKIVKLIHLFPGDIVFFKNWSSRFDYVVVYDVTGIEYDIPWSLVEPCPKEKGELTGEEFIGLCKMLVKYRKDKAELQRVEQDLLEYRGRDPKQYHSAEQIVQTVYGME